MGSAATSLTMNDSNPSSRAIVATIPFGMGVRFVIHADPPVTIEAYWQEIGRAGRDRAPAEGIILYSASAWALRRIVLREVDTVKTVQARKVRQLYELPRGRRAPLFWRDRGRRLRPVRPQLNPPEATDVTAAQKAPSAVHRLGGRFGRGRIVDHLQGKTKDASTSETQTSTFGIGREHSAAWLARPA
jgi:ATP-dependent DNA helicase RecQ